MQVPEIPDLDRRRLLTVAALCLSGSVLPASLAEAAAGADVAGALPWQPPFVDSRAAAAVGRQYLRQCPEEASAAWLTESLFGGEPALEKIRAGRQQDFLDGDVVVIDGWFFARTEARLLALISMHAA